MELGFLIFLFLLETWGVPLINNLFGYNMINDPKNPWAYFIILPAIALSIFFSRRTNSLKEALFEGFGWAAIQFVAIVAIYSMDTRDLSILCQLESL